MRRGGLTLEEAQPTDAAALAALDQRASPHPWTEEHFAASLRHAPVERVLILRAPLAPGRPVVGFCVVTVAADEAQIQNLAIEPALRGRRLGRLLLATTLALAARRGAHEAFLEVRAGNQAALALYQRLGFVRRGLRASYYMQPSEDAVLMSLSLHGLGPGPRAEGAEG